MNHIKENNTLICYSSVSASHPLLLSTFLIPPRFVFIPHLRLAHLFISFISSTSSFSSFSLSFSSGISKTILEIQRGFNLSVKLNRKLLTVASAIRPHLRGKKSRKWSLKRCAVHFNAFSHQQNYPESNETRVRKNLVKLMSILCRIDVDFAEKMINDPTRLVWSHQFQHMHSYSSERDFLTRK